MSSSREILFNVPKPRDRWLRASVHAMQKRFMRPSPPTAGPVPQARPPLLERMGIWYFRALSRAARQRAATDPVHELNTEERASLRRIQRAAIARAAAAGSVSSIVSAAAEIWVTPPHPDTAADPWVFWGVVGGATALASVVEILYLYWDGLRAVHGLATAAGLDLFPHGDAGHAVAASMARAALELPNPPDPVHGIDPRREASRARLVLASLFYKLKVSVTNFVVKALVRRMLGRTMLRTWLLPFVAVPVTAAWNGLVCWFILREARIRAMGASAAREMVGSVFRAAGTPTPAQRDVVLRGVAATIVRTVDAHPNLLAVLDAVRDAVGSTAAPGAPPPEGLDDTAGFLSRLRALPAPEQGLVLRVLGVAAIIDGRMTGAERRLWREAREAAGLPPDERPLKVLLRAFVHGDRVPEDLLIALG